MRSNVFFNTTEISHNQFEAGLRIYQGAGEVIVNNTLLEKNSGSGINVTYSGGYQLFNNTRLHDNHGYGIITEYLNVNKTRIERRMLVEVVRCGFQLNEGIALRLGNYCNGGLMLVNLSHFSQNMDEAIEYLSCNVTTLEIMNFTAAYNLFDGNKRHGILASPLLNTVGIMTNNTFINHRLGCVRVENGYDLIINRWYSRFRVNYEIFENEFSMNNGRYAISLRLTQNSVFQKLDCKFNRFTNNYIQESFAAINPRSRANAVAIISSSNVIFQRNSIDNPDSLRAVSTHLVDPSVTIDATHNWWGSPNHAFIYDQIFDQDDRYNLAFVEYFPALLVDLVYDNVPTLPPRHHWQFHRGSTIGGTLESRIVLPRGVYNVDKDIFIKPSYRLVIASGSILQFETSIGIVVHGCLTADGGSEGNAILFSLQESSVQIDNETLTVRLLDGEDEYEGRLEVQINGVWGTICDQVSLARLLFRNYTTYKQ